MWEGEQPGQVSNLERSHRCRGSTPAGQLLGRQAGGQTRAVLDGAGEGIHEIMKR